MMYGFAVQKGSPWKNLITKKIMRYIEEGVIAKLNAKWLAGSCLNLKTKSLDDSMYSLKYFASLFLVLLGALVALLLVGICLYLARKCKSVRLYHVS